MRADALAHRHLCTGGRGRPGLGLAQSGEGQRAERSQTTGSETRAAQEGSAVEAAIRFAC
jgi:hypothetical protein